MVLRVLAWIFAGLTACSAVSAEDPPVDFDLDVLPILTKFGCNSGACHGAAVGRGEFRLSLFGSRPDDDLKAITRHLESRRINLAHPDRSLFLLKPTGSVDHAGGLRFEPLSREARKLQQWIAEGAVRSGQSRVVALKAEPAAIMAEVGSETSLRIMGTLNDGSVRDVTADISLVNADPDAISVNSDAIVTPHRSGRHILIVRYPGLVLPVEVLVPFPRLSRDANSDGSDLPTASFVDRRINSRLRLMRLNQSPAADDATFLCRATLNLTGRRPDAEQIRMFLREKSPDKRTDLIDALMRSIDFTEFWTWQLSQMLRVHDSRSVEAAVAWRAWLREQLISEAPLNDVAAQMILASGDPDVNGAAAFHTVTQDARSQAEHFSESFLGIRLRCANCHDHPLDRWTQDDYHGLAAIFATVDRGASIGSKPGGTTIHPSTGLPARPQVLLSSKSLSEADPRITLGKWISDADNSLFARNVVNRVWKQLMGRGLVEPIDDMRVTNPPTHPELLDELSQYFIENGFRLKPLIREICLSETWFRGSSVGVDSVDTLFWSSRPPARLSPEVLLDCLGDVTGVPEEIPGQSDASVRIIHLARLSAPMPSLEALGRCPEKGSCAGGDVVSTDSLPLALHLINGALLNRRLTPESPLIKPLIAVSDDHSKVIEELYLRVLSRPAQPAELDVWIKELDAALSADRMESTIIDIAWALLTSDEFLTCP